PLPLPLRLLLADLRLPLSGAGAVGPAHQERHEDERGQTKHVLWIRESDARSTGKQIVGCPGSQRYSEQPCQSTAVPGAERDRRKEEDEGVALERRLEQVHREKGQRVDHDDPARPIQECATLLQPAHRFSWRGLTSTLQVVGDSVS